MPRRVAILHHALSFYPLDLRWAIGEDIEPVWVLLDEGAEDRMLRRILRRLGPVVEIAGLDLDAAAARLAEAEVGGIVTFVEHNLVLAAELALRLGLRFHSPDVATVLADKRLQRAALATAGVPGPRFWPLPGALQGAGLRALARQVRYPAVLKPAAGTGSRGVLALSGPDDLVDLHCDGVDRLVEEFLPDDPGCDGRFASYLSVESVVSQGRREHVAITGRFPLAEPFRESGNFIPAAVPADGHDELYAITDAAIDALGITTGVLHTEIKLTPLGPQLIEVNGRLGHRPPFVLQSISEINLFRTACEVALGLEPTLSLPASWQGVGYWRMIQPPTDAHRVLDVRGLDDLLAASHVDSVRLAHGRGDDVDWREGTDSFVLSVRGRVADVDALAEAIAFIDRTVEIDYDAGPASSYAARNQRGRRAATAGGRRRPDARGSAAAAGEKRSQ